MDAWIRRNRNRHSRLPGVCRADKLDLQFLAWLAGHREHMGGAGLCRGGNGVDPALIAVIFGIADLQEIIAALSNLVGQVWIGEEEVVVSRQLAAVAVVKREQWISMLLQIMDLVLQPGTVDLEGQ